MASLYIYILVGVLGIVSAFIVFGFVYLLVKRHRRELKGDIYHLPEDTRTKGERPIEIQTAEDYMYERGGQKPPKN
ncbi:MAG TPA: hypothetical protein VMX55_12425 [candidate division Zixibacteria bacterium]|nr:hypothetical protein [candidate division Zixibacteria bacterium]